jgi:hypothetical protein
VKNPCLTENPIQQQTELFVLAIIKKFVLAIVLAIVCFGHIFGNRSI